MNWMTRITVLAIAALGLCTPIAAQNTTDPQGLLVVYGVDAPNSEGDVDHREQILFSIPQNTPGRIYVRLFDPEISGRDDFTRGGPRDSLTTFRVIGGDGAFTTASRPQMIEDRSRPPRIGIERDGGRMLIEAEYDSDAATNGRWVTLGAIRARQGEIIDGRAYFRLDVEGTKGNDGNGYSMGVSVARDRNRAPDGLDMFAYQPTIRWTKNTAPTRVTFASGSTGPYQVQSFDGAKGDLLVITDYQDIEVEISGQAYWSVDTVEAAGTTLALSLEDGFETPNDVTVSVFDVSGAPVGLLMPPVRALDPARPVASGTARPLADCRAVAFDGNGSTGRAPLGYVWDFGDGSLAAQSVIAHRYADVGRYDATLRVLEAGTRPGRGSEIIVPVHVRNGPTAKPGDAITIAPGQAVIFDGTGSLASDSPIARYTWTFGDGTTANGSTATKTYETPGLYRTNLRVEDDSAHPCFFGVETRDVTVNFAPVAEAGTDQTAETGQVLGFTGTASYDVDGTIETYRWSMGDGTVIEGANVTHAYETSGTFTVTLSVIDDSGVANNITDDTMTVSVNAPPAPVFTIPPRPVSVSEAAELSAADTVDTDGTILSYMWDFGDGAVGDGEIVNYAWMAPGVYNVVLTVTDDSGTASATQRFEKQIVIDAAPTANAGPDQFVTASEVQFDATASTDPEGAISSFEWDFGDGSVGTGPKPVHAYSRPGIYEVALIVRDDSGAPLNSNRDTTLITVNASPIADAGPPQTVSPNEEFILSGRASLDPDGMITDYTWTMPDGAAQSAERVAVSLRSPGLYRFGLTVADNFSGGVATDTSETLITVNAAPVAEAGADLLVAPGDPVRLNGALSFDPDGKIISYLWEFNDGAAAVSTSIVERTFDSAGVWSAQLLVSDDSGVANATASDSLTIRVNNPPQAEAGPPINTEVLQVSFDGSGSSDADGDTLIYKWDFGDGSTPVMGVKVTHVYKRTGIYPVTLTIDDATGLGNATALDTTVVTIKARPIASAGLNRDVCSGQPILFDASDSVDPDGGLLQYAWDFGDGDTSDLINPTKTYEQPGSYPVTLKIRNGTQTDWGSDVARIAALVREGPIADAGADMTVCTNQAVRFDGAGSTDADGAVNAFAWTFGDGGTASGERPEYRFKKPGNYAVNLTITGEALGSCSPLDTDTVNVEVVAAPNQNVIGSERAAAGMPASFSVSLTELDGASVISHTWAFSDGSTGQGTDVTHVFEKPGIYYVDVRTDLTGGNAGCSTLDTRRKVIVNDAPIATMSAPDQVATGQAVVFDAAGSRDTDGAITDFAWDFGDGTTTQGVRATHVYAKSGRYSVTLTVTDDAGVGNSSVVLARDVVVNPLPLASLTTPEWVCPMEDLTWAVETPDSTIVTWDFGDGATATGTSATHQFVKPGLYPVSIDIDDGNELANSLRRETRYVRANATPTAFAGPDQTICPGDVTVFDASGSRDPDGNITQFEWQFSDGITLQGPRVERSFDSAGHVIVTLKITDNSGTTCGVSEDVLNLLVNATPVVDAGPDLTMKLGGAHDLATFDASGAQDADNQGLHINWDFGDSATATGATARHRYTSAGTYEIVVTARDTTGLVCGIGRDTATITTKMRE